MKTKENYIFSAEKEVERQGKLCKCGAPAVDIFKGKPICSGCLNPDEPIVVSLQCQSAIAECQVVD